VKECFVMAKDAGFKVGRLGAGAAWPGGLRVVAEGGEFGGAPTWLAWPGVLHGGRGWRVWWGAHMCQGP